MIHPAQKFVQDYAIQEKFELLKKFKQGKLTQDEVIKIIEDRRVKWIKKNIKKLKHIYNNLPSPVMAHRIIFFNHMYIFPPDSVVLEISDKLIVVRSYNFCPYLEACKLLDLDTKFICKNICEKPVNEMIKHIHPKLRFWRNYNHIRPHQKYCEEYIALID